MIAEYIIKYKKAFNRNWQSLHCQKIMMEK